MSLARSILDRTLGALGVIERRARAMRHGVTILMYHRVLPDDLWARSTLPNLVMPESAFRAQVELFARRFDVRRAHDAVARARMGDYAEERPTIAITFDDGYADNARVAAPILVAAGLSATFYIVTGLVGTPGELWFDRAIRRFRGSTPDAARNALGAATLANSSSTMTAREWVNALKMLSPSARDAAIDALQESPSTPPRHDLDHMMSLDELRAMSAKGHEIGAHTVTHPILTTLELDAQRTEIDSSRAALTTILGEPNAPTGFCYPNGSYSTDTARAVRLAGYSYAVSTAPGRMDEHTDTYAIPRIDMNPHHVTAHGTHDPRALLAEISLLRHAIRKLAGKAPPAPKPSPNSSTASPTQPIHQS
ncbi:MAG: polysaccharide deacetylase family protein [Phycisphaerales bacterium]|nr:MAG: polysaccharide deacetylase family protein [Phycisphaerales bacterium]